MLSFLLITGLFNFTLKIKDIRSFMKFKQFAVLLAVIIFSTWIIAINLSPSIGSVKTGNYSFINKKGLLVINPQYSEVLSFSQGLAAVKLNDKWGYINKNGKALVKPQFNQASSFSEGVAAVTVDGNKWEYIDKTGRRAIRLQFDGIPGLFFEGLASVTIYEDGYPKNNGYINKRGQLVIKTEFSETDNFSEGLAVVETGDGICGIRADYCAYGYIDKTGKMVIGAGFTNAEKFSQGLAAVATYGNSDGANAYGYYFDKWGYINKLGRLVTKPEFSTANNFSEGLAAVEIGRIHNNSDEAGMPTEDIGGKWGYIDETGKQVISAQFDLANSFSEGLAVVRVKDNCGYINKIGKFVVQPQFSSCEDFAEGLAAVKTSIK